MTDRTSLWEALAAPHRQRREPLTGDLDTEIAVVGAGAVGLTIALRLAETGRRVTVFEARDIAAGTTGGTTGKVTSQHGVLYADLVERHGEDAARGYAHGNQRAVAELPEICDRYGIDAAASAADAFVFARDEDEAATLRRELDAARRLGLPAEWADTIELPFEVTGAVRFRDQLQIDAVAWCLGLAVAVEGRDGCSVHTGTRVTDVQEVGDRVGLRTSTGSVVTADHVVLATLAPITDRGFEFARMTPVRAHGLAAEIDGDLPEQLHISAGDPGRSVRHHRAADAAYLVVVGASYEPGDREAAATADAELEAWTREHWDVRRIAHRWSAQDLLPHDRLPFVGPTAFADRVSVATGFQKWGLSNAFLAADVLVAQLDAREHPMAAALSPRRLTVTESAREFVRHNTEVAARFVADRVSPTVSAPDDVPPGGGATVRVDGELLAVSRDDAGRPTACSAICSHLGCVVAWNAAERSWGCPCHGSRFAPDGTVLDGPATEPLEPRELPDA